MKNILIAGLIALSAMSATSASAYNFSRDALTACGVFTFGLCIFVAKHEGDTVDGKPIK